MYLPIGKCFILAKCKFLFYLLTYYILIYFIIKHNKPNELKIAHFTPGLIKIYLILYR